MDVQDIQKGVEVAKQGVNALSKLVSTVGEIYYIFGGKSREIRKLADANAYASIVAAETKNKVAMIEVQGADEVVQFVLAKESRRMQNTINVIEKTEKFIEPTEIATDESIDPDWLTRFFSIAEDVSDDEMQNLWAQILAGEIKKPNSYSLRTLEVLRNMTQEDAQLLNKASKYIIGGDLGLCSEKYSLPLLDVVKLGEMGIVNSDNLLSNIEIEPNDSDAIELGKKTALIGYNTTNNKLIITYNIRVLTSAGKELLQLITPLDSDDEFIREIVKRLKSKCSKVIKCNLKKINENNEPEFEDEGIEM